MTARGHMAEGQFGALSIWEQPMPGSQYVIGVDTSSGIRESVKEGDPSAACVLEMRTCRQVAEMHGYQDPTMWGWACARVAWYYNEAWLAIETQPSQHGLTAFLAAERYGYVRLCRQRKIESLRGQFVERRGWVRPARSSETLFNRVRTAQRESCIIRSHGLLDEMAAMRLEEGKFISDEHDDRLIAYAIALLARDQLFAEGEVVEERKPPRDLAELYWQAQAELDQKPHTTTNADELALTWDGG
jgi:hypothetical protein